MQIGRERVLVIHHGHLLFDGGLSALAAEFSSTKTITVQLADGPLAGRTVDVLVSAAQGARFGAGEDVVLSAAATPRPTVPAA